SQPPSTDSPAIASLFAQSWTSPFTRLQFGHVDAATLAEAMAPHIKEQMGKSHTRFVAMWNGEEGAAVTQWMIPQDHEEETGREDESAREEEEEEGKEEQEQREEREKFEDEAYRNKLPECCNKDLVMEFTHGLRRLRATILGGRKHYLLENIATHPLHRSKGLASKLVKWAFPQADAQNVPIYLDTASDNPAKGLYEKLGFQEQGRSTIKDLERFGGEGGHTHVGLVRYPKNAA
ncbi:hypothetical protein K458DRAFT_289642, partial [Lentithecium fluviatile CBS 122367]